MGTDKREASRSAAALRRLRKPQCITNTTNGSSRNGPLRPSQFCKIPEG
jgi:hypothetical protein